MGEFNRSFHIQSKIIRTETQIDRERDRQKYRKIDRERKRQTNRQIGRERHREKHRWTER